MSSAFLKGMLHGRAGSENPPLWENEQSWMSSTKLLWEGVRRRSRDAFEHQTALGRGEKEEQERWAMVTWTLTLCFVAFQPWSFRVWTGAVPSSGPSQECGMG